MGRHSDGLTNYKFSTHVYVVIACLVVVVIIIVFWVKAIHGDSTRISRSAWLVISR